MDIVRCNYVMKTMGKCQEKKNKAGKALKNIVVYDCSNDEYIETKMITTFPLPFGCIASKNVILQIMGF